MMVLKVSRYPGIFDITAWKSGLSQIDFRGGSTTLALMAAQVPCSFPGKYWTNSQAAFLFFDDLLMATCQIHSFAPTGSPSFMTGGGEYATFPALAEPPGTFWK